MSARAGALRGCASAQQTKQAEKQYPATRNPTRDHLISAPPYNQTPYVPTELSPALATRRSVLWDPGTHTYVITWLPRNLVAPSPPSITQRAIPCLTQSVQPELRPKAAADCHDSVQPSIWTPTAIAKTISAPRFVAAALARTFCTLRLNACREQSYVSWFAWSALDRAHV